MHNTLENNIIELTQDNLNKSQIFNENENNESDNDNRSAESFDSLGTLSIASNMENDNYELCSNPNIFKPLTKIWEKKIEK